MTNSKTQQIIKLSCRIIYAACGLGVSHGTGIAQTDPPGIVFRHTITGEVLDLADALPQGRNTPGVNEFLRSGVNPYNEDPSCLKAGEQIFLSACSGCHGHIGEGKIGPGLNDDYWTYPQNATDAGLFSTIFGGAQAQMGPQSENLTLDEMLQVMAWVRHLYKDDVIQAPWLSPEQKSKYKPYQAGEKFPEDAPGQCAKPQ